jgi:hypothetical protein
MRYVALRFGEVCMEFSKLKTAYKAARRPSTHRSVPAKPVATSEQKFMALAMGLLDGMPDDQYKVASDRLAKIASKTRAYRRSA